MALIKSYKFRKQIVTYYSSIMNGDENRNLVYDGFQHGWLFFTQLLAEQIIEEQSVQ